MLSYQEQHAVKIETVVLYRMEATVDDFPLRIVIPVYFYTRSNYNDFRRMKLIAFSHYLNMHKDFALLSDEDKLAIVKDLERGCYHTTIDKALSAEIRNSWTNENFLNTYHSVCYKVSANLDSDLVDTDQLIQKILNGEVMPIDVGKMSSQDIHPEQYTELNRKIADRRSKKINVNTSRLYKCGRCQKFQCTMERQTTRALDEGATFRITCQFCGKTWNG
jgi:DNA-directed RNA polymerase subunit M/transcription elongation factor TFIIS